MDSTNNNKSKELETPKKMISKTKSSFREYTQHAQERASVRGWFSKLLFLYISPLIRVARKEKKLDIETHIASAVGTATSHDLVEDFIKHGKRIRDYKNSRALFFGAIRAVCFADTMRGVVFATIYILCQLSVAYLVYLLVRTLGDANAPISYAIGYTVTLAFVQILSAFANQFSLHYTYAAGLKLRSLFIGLLYRHYTELRTEFIPEDLSVSNLVAIDCQKFVEICEVANFVWMAPLATMLGTVILFLFIGISAFAGVGILLLLIPFNYGLGSFLQLVRRNHMPLLDERVSLLSDIVQNIRVVKYYSWDIPFLDKLLRLRDKEMPYVYREVGAWAGLITVLIVTPALACLASFSLHVLRGMDMAPDIVFGSLVVFTWLKFPLMHFSQGLTMAIQLAVAISRINKFLCLGSPDDESDTVKTISSIDTAEEAAAIEEQPAALPSTSKFEIDFNETDIRWHSNSAITVKHAALHIPKGKLVIICGPVGSGKSSLLQFLIGEISTQAGHQAALPHQVAYCSQVPFIMNRSVADNIKFQPERVENLKEFYELYRKVVHACCLQPDFEDWAFGDRTMIGERGVTLSGGQKARVAIARACLASLQNSIPIFLDDPLSALDMKTSQMVFDRVLSNSRGLLAGTTRLLVTHNMNLLASADLAIVLNEGEIIYHGKPSDLPPIKELQSVDRSNPLHRTLRKLCKNVTENEHDETRVHDQEAHYKDEDDLEDDTNLMQDEDKESSTGISLRVFVAYIKAGGGWLWFWGVVVSFVLERASYVSVDFFLAEWTKAANSTDPMFLWIHLPTDSSSEVFPLLYMALIGIMFVFVLFRLELFALGLAYCAKHLVNRMISEVLGASIVFFETQPHGRIMNRLSYDVEVLDLPLVQSLNGTFASLLWLLTSFIVMLALVPIAVVGLIPAVAIFVYYYVIYRGCCVELQRVDNVTRSPMMACLHETVHGAVTVRAYGQIRMMVDRMNELVDMSYCAIWAFAVSNRWLGVRLELLGSIVTLAVSVGSLITKSSISPSYVGLALTWSFNCAISFQFFVSLSTKAEAKMTSVERVVYYCEQLPHDSPHNIPEEDSLLAPEWPEQGRVVFKDVVLRYRPDYEPALKSVSFEINPGERVGIVGRTGSGKSTLGQCLMRIRDPESGLILVDGKNILSLGTSALRGRRSGGACIIPQDPVVFNGTLRYNLDPFSNYSDAELWRVLKLVQLEEMIQSLFPEIGLSANLSSSGLSLSVGQNQLLCLARALLRNPKVLIMDEATASVDADTDHLIQQTVKEHFQGTTVIEIAHRLHSVVTADRLLVLDHGVLIEFGTPAELVREDVEHPTMGLKAILDSMKPKERELLVSMIKYE